MRPTYSITTHWRFSHRAGRHRCQCRLIDVAARQHETDPLAGQFVGQGAQAGQADCPGTLTQVVRAPQVGPKGIGDGATVACTP